MIDRIQSWKARLAKLQKKSTSSKHKFKYAETILTQIESFYNVGQIDIAETILNRLDAWAQRHSSIMLDHTKHEALKPFSNTFSSDIYRKEFDHLTTFFVQKQQYIPKPDMEYIATALSDVKKSLDLQESGDLIQSRLKAIKSRLFDRLHRSLRAQFSASVFLRPFTKIDNQVGPYNNANNLSEVCKLISERDAIWIDDLIQLYGSLFKLENKVTLRKKAT